MLRYYSDNEYICMHFNNKCDRNVYRSLGLKISTNDDSNDCIFKHYVNKYREYLKYCTYEIYKKNLENDSKYQVRYKLIKNIPQTHVFERGIDNYIDFTTREIELKSHETNQYKFELQHDQKYEYKLRIIIDKELLFTNIKISESEYLIFKQISDLISNDFYEINFHRLASIFATLNSDLLIDTAKKHCIMINDINSSCTYHTTNLLTTNLTNEDCINCIDCYDCKSCIDCRNCTMCINCNYCSDCNGVENEVNCH